MKKVITLMLLVSMFVMMLGVTSAEDFVLDTTEEGKVDFCVYNIWADSYINVPTASEVTNVRMTVEVSNFAGEAVTCKLFSQDSLTWTLSKSEAQTIDADGTYVFELTYGTPITGDDLNTLFIKDLQVCSADEDEAAGELAESAGSATISLTSVEWNFEAEADDGGDDVTAPETGDVNIIIIAAIAVLALGSVVVSASKKARA